ncbi:DUF4184 family protein [Nocardia sp. SYP-A9097]|uniref:DUF4184 family protein n=1 Tax=Nocardia sp. SYP-A9097 TaxID=2663237 RepID=UPI00189112A0|nr:DUF4184 family protein [Nocardia sp. SYP-A9097]
MPFTLAHPAAVLPLARKLWLPGLVAGSIAPDVPYFLPVGVDGELTHSLLGLPVDLALGVALLALGWVIHRPILGLLGKAATPPRTTWWRAVAAITVGIPTHLAWDAFTHTDGPVVQHWELMREPVVGPHRVYNVIGYLSSIGGLLVLAWFSARWYHRAQPGPTAAQRNWVLTGIALVAAAGALLASTDPVVDISLYDAVRHLLVGAIQSAAVAFGVWALVASALPRSG